MCNTNMIMSYLAKIEMSGLGNAKLPYFKGGWSGEKGHYHVKSGGTEAPACTKESN